MSFHRVRQPTRWNETVSLAPCWLAGKPFSIRAGCIHDYVELGVLRPLYVHTDHQLADLHTKPLARLKLEAILKKLCLTAGRPVSSKTGETDRRLVLSAE